MEIYMVQAVLAALLPAVMADYYLALDAKHFAFGGGVGSRFRDLLNINHLLTLLAKGVNLMVDDHRQKFVALGVESDALLPFCRYILVETRGYNGIVKAGDLDANTLVTAVTTKPGCPCSLTVEGIPLQPTTIGTLILGPGENGEPWVVWTAHPGLPIRPTSAEEGVEEGTTFLAGDLQPNSWLQIR